MFLHFTNNVCYLSGAENCSRWKGLEIGREANNADEGVIERKPRLDASDGWPISLPSAVETSVPSLR